MKTAPFLFAGIGLMFALAPVSAQQNQKADAFINTLHSGFVSRFEDLSEFTKDGEVMGFEEVLKYRKHPRFGVSRLPDSKIKSHGSNVRSPLSNGNDFYYHTTIFGASGRPLTPNNIRVRYTRRSEFLSRAPYSLAKDSPSHKPINIHSLAKKVVGQWSKSPAKPVRIKDGVRILEVRPVKLSNKDCLKCHVGMKVGDPVAAIAYNLIPIVKK